MPITYVGAGAAVLEQNFPRRGKLLCFFEKFCPNIEHWISYPPLDS